MPAIPPHAKKVFSGEIFDVHQWEQTLYDGSTATFEMLKRPNTVEVIAVADNHILLAYEEQPNKGPHYTLFGGRQEPDEEPLEAIQREFLEESGHASDDWDLFHSAQPVGKIEWTIYTYIALHCKKIQEPMLDPGEKIEIRPVSFDEFIDIATGDEFYGRELAFQILKMQRDRTLEAFQKRLFG